MTSTAAISGLILQYGYVLFLLLATIEGPIVTIIAAFLASQGLLNVYIVYVLAILGDLISDAVYYYIGRSGHEKFLSKYGHYVGVTEERVRWAAKHFDNHLWKTIAFGKFTQAPILFIIIGAGMARVNFWKLMFVIFIVSLPKILILTSIGYFFGKSYALFSTYLDYYVYAFFGLIAVVLIAYILNKKFIKK